MYYMVIWTTSQLLASQIDMRRDRIVPSSRIYLTHIGLAWALCEPRGALSSPQRALNLPDVLVPRHARAELPYGEVWMR